MKLIMYYNKKETNDMKNNMKTFVAIDFETANRYRNSACSVALVRVENGKIVKTVNHLICPPDDWFEFTNVHGLTWSDVKGESNFKKVWQGADVQDMLNGMDTFVAHNAPFDKSVLHACCDYYSIKKPKQLFVCTVQMSRKTFNLENNQLPTVARHLGIKLNHHDALSDALACAKIMLAI